MIDCERTEKQKECYHKHFTLIYDYQGILIGYCPDCDMVVKLDLYSMEEDVNEI